MTDEAHTRRRWLDSRTAERDAWADWLGTDWAAFATLTFRGHPPGTGRCRKSHDRLVRWLDRTHASPPRYFVGYEVGEQGRGHLHALYHGIRVFPLQRTLGAIGAGSSTGAGLGTGGSTEVPFLWLSEWWRREFGRAQVVPYNPDRGAGYYLTKYVTKELGWFDGRGLRECH